MICICWDGFPQYGARCVGALVGMGADEVVVVATRPSVPIKGMDRLARCKVIWVETSEKRSIAEICGKMPQLMTIPGWFSPLYNKWRDEVRSAGGTVVCGCDNNYDVTWRTLFLEIAKAIRFRLLFRSKYDYFWVPGESGKRLMRFYGVDDRRIVTGSYAADGALFRDLKPMLQRPKQMIFVGRLCERKNVLRLCQAFLRANVPEWSLDLYGCGSLRDSLLKIAADSSGRIRVHDFAQPEQLAGCYANARVFCLPSLREHWGLVVHEAALTGCALLLSNCIGAGEDFLDEGVNGFSFDPRSISDMAQKFRALMNWEDSQIVAAHDVSVAKAQNCSTQKFANSVLKMMSAKIGCRMA